MQKIKNTLFTIVNIAAVILVIGGAGGYEVYGKASSLIIAFVAMAWLVFVTLMIGGEENE